MPRLTSLLLTGGVKLDERYLARHSNLKRFKTVHKLATGDMMDIPKGTRGKPWCVTQMVAMLECLKENELSQRACAKQIKAFDECVASYVDPSGKPISGATGVSKMERVEEVNRMLAKYPTNSRR